MDEIKQVEENTEVKKKILDAYIKTEELETRLKKIKKDILDLIPNTLDDLCGLIDIQTKIAKIISELTSILDETIIITASLDGLYDYKASKVVLKKLGKLGLGCKKLMAALNIRTLKFTRKMLTGIKQGKGSKAANVITVPISTLQTMATVISKISEILDIIAKATASLLPISAQGMTMMPTPKSIALGYASLTKGVEALIANSNMSSGNRMSELEEAAITEIEDKVADENRKTVASAVSSSANSASDAATGDGEMKFDPFPMLKAIDVREIYNMIQAYLMLLPEAEPLPKYEDMEKSAGFWLWLLTGFEFMIQKSFGLPA